MLLLMLPRTEIIPWIVYWFPCFSEFTDLLLGNKDHFYYIFIGQHERENKRNSILINYTAHYSYFVKSKLIDSHATAIFKVDANETKANLSWDDMGNNLCM